MASEISISDYTLSDLGSYFVGTTMPFIDAQNRVRLALITDVSGEDNPQFQYYPNLINGTGWSQRQFRKGVDQFFYSTRWKSRTIQHDGDACIVTVTGARSRQKGLGSDQFGVQRVFGGDMLRASPTSTPEMFVKYVSLWMQPETIRSYTVLEAKALIEAGEDYRSIALNSIVSIVFDQSSRFRLAFNGAAQGNWTRFSKNAVNTALGSVFSQTIPFGD
jgi:hypothetical protein